MKTSLDQFADKSSKELNLPPLTIPPPIPTFRLFSNLRRLNFRYKREREKLPPKDTKITFSGKLINFLLRIARFSPATTDPKPQIITTLIINFPPKSIIIFQDPIVGAIRNSFMHNTISPICHKKLLLARRGNETKRKNMPNFSPHTPPYVHHHHRESKTTNDKIKKIDCCLGKTTRSFPHIFFVFLLFFVCFSLGVQ